MSSEFKHTGRWSVSLPSLGLPVCLHKLQRLGQVSKSLETSYAWQRSRLEAVFIGQQNFKSHAFLFREYLSRSLAFKPLKRVSVFYVYHNMHHQSSHAVTGA